MKLFVISLVRSNDRRQLIEGNLVRLGLTFEIFNGIDAGLGEHVGLSRYSEAATLHDFHRPLAEGEVGCFASHYRLWQQCIKAGEPFVILEDDTVVDDGFVQALEAVPGLLPDFPLVRLGITAEGAGTAHLRDLALGYELVSLAPGTYGTQCYVLSSVAAKALVEHAAVWTLPVDIYIDRPQKHGIGCYGLRPYFVRHADQTAYPSLIGDERYGLRPDPSVKIQIQIEDFLVQRGRKLLNV